MIAVIDTSSLLHLVRYYLPFDKNDLLKNFIKRKIETSEIIILDKVAEESSYVAGKLIIKSFDFLKEKSIQTKTDNLHPDGKFFSLLESHFCVPLLKNKLSDIEFESLKNAYLDGADAKLILYCQKNKYTEDLGFEKVKVILVTEETISENDNKLFKKIPAICKILDIDCCSLPTLFKEHFGLKLSEYLE